MSALRFSKNEKIKQFQIYFANIHIYLTVTFVNNLREKKTINYPCRVYDFGFKYYISLRREVDICYQDMKIIQSISDIFSTQLNFVVIIINSNCSLLSSVKDLILRVSYSLFYILICLFNIHLLTPRYENSYSNQHSYLWKRIQG